MCNTKPIHFYATELKNNKFCHLKSPTIQNHTKGFKCTVFDRSMTASYILIILYGLTHVYMGVILLILYDLRHVYMVVILLILYDLRHVNMGVILLILYDLTHVYMGVLVQYMYSISELNAFGVYIEV